MHAKSVIALPKLGGMSAPAHCHLAELGRIRFFGFILDSNLDSQYLQHRLAASATEGLPDGIPGGNEQVDAR